MTIAEFSDGLTLPAFDADLSDTENQALARAITIEARRRQKAGLPFHGRLRELRDGEQIQTKQAS